MGERIEKPDASRVDTAASQSLIDEVSQIRRHASLPEIQQPKKDLPVVEFIFEGGVINPARPNADTGAEHALRSKAFPGFSPFEVKFLRVRF